MSTPREDRTLTLHDALPILATLAPQERQAPPGYRDLKVRQVPPAPRVRRGRKDRRGRPVQPEPLEHKDKQVPQERDTQRPRQRHSQSGLAAQPLRPKRVSLIRRAHEREPLAPPTGPTTWKVWSRLTRAPV